jgi:hypothetical protein
MKVQWQVSLRGQTAMANAPIREVSQEQHSGGCLRHVIAGTDHANAAPRNEESNLRPFGPDSR